MASDGGDGTSTAVPMASTSTPVTSSASTTDQDVPNASFTTLPEELVSNIAVKLGSDDHFNLRLTCKDLEAKSRHEFATEYFSKKAFMFLSDSLNALLAISKSDKFRHYLREIFILTALVTESHRKCCHNGKSNYNPTVRQHEAFLFYKADQNALQKHGGDLKLLSDAFARLPRVECLFLVDDPSTAARDPSLRQPAKCLGLTKFERTTGTSPSFWCVDGSASLVPEHDPWMAHLFQTILLAVAASGIGPTYLGDRLHHKYGLSPVTDLKMTAKTAHLLAKALHNTGRLDLTLRSRGFRAGKQDSNQDLERAARNIKRFSGAAAAGLTKLILNFDFGESSGPLARAFFNNIDLGKLVHFRLHSVKIDLGSLAAAIGRLRSAEKIELVLVEIQGSWIPILNALQNLPRLTHLHMQYLQSDGQKCFFLEKPDEGDDDDQPNAGGDSEDGDDDGSIPSLSVQDDAAVAGEDMDVDDLVFGVMNGGSYMDDHDQPGANAWPGTQPDAGGSTEQVKKKKQKKSGKGCPGRTPYHRSPRTYDRLGRAERGYYICLQGAEIREQLPTFMKEYNLGGNSLGLNSIDGMLANIAAQLPPGVGGMAGAMAGMFAMPVPPAAGGGAYGPPPPPPAPGQGQPGNPLAGAADPLAAALSYIMGGQLPPVPPPPPATAPPATAPTTTAHQGENETGNATTPAAPTAGTTTTTTTTTTSILISGTAGQHGEDWWTDDEPAQGGLDDVS